jgi:hypothetical protein
MRASVDLPSLQNSKTTKRKVTLQTVEHAIQPGIASIEYSPDLQI